MTAAALMTATDDDPSADDHARPAATPRGEMRTVVRLAQPGKWPRNGLWGATTVVMPAAPRKP